MLALKIAQVRPRTVHHRYQTRTNFSKIVHCSRRYRRKCRERTPKPVIKK